MTGVRTGWVEPPIAIRGLDHLGAQAPCIALYAQLLPGITNVTDRARYFSFYPWVIWSFESRSADHSVDAFTRFLRRADCLFSMAAIRHRAVVDGPLEEHDMAVIGSRRLGPAVAELAEGGAPIDLEKFAAPHGESADRYFGSAWGGLGQYYFGSLATFGLVGMKDGFPKGPPGFDRERGRAIAEAFDRSVDADRFFDVVASREVRLEDLDALSAFCPCALHSSVDERGLLLDFFFGRTTHQADENPGARRSSFALLLDIARIAEPQKLEWTLRAAAYSGQLPAESPWELPDHLASLREQWGTYATNELLSVAVQSLFWAVLQGVEHLRGRKLRTATEAGEVLLDLAERDAAELLRGSVGEMVDVVASSLPPLGAWNAEEHEVQRADALIAVSGRTAGSPDDLGPVVQRSLQLILALLARGRGAPDAYRAFDFEAGRFGGGAIDLVALGQRAGDWREMSMRDWVRWLGVEWCVQRHLRVALRKLRIEHRDTFRLRPLDGELRLVDIPPATFTGPRVTRARQILLDLGLLARREEALILTDSGWAVLEDCRAR